MIEERIEQIRVALDLTQSEYSKILGILQSNYSRLKSGASKVTADMLLGLKEHNINIDWLLTGEGAMFQTAQSSTKNEISIIDSNSSENSFLIPLLDQKLSAGMGEYLPEEDEPKALIAVPKYLSRYGKEVAALYVDGDSMEPTLSRGDVIVCDSQGWSGEGIYAIQMNGCGFVKRLSMAPGKMIVHSDNVNYPSWDVGLEDESVKIVGRVHAVLKEVK